VVELLKRRENVLVVRGLDAGDGTPVLGLKLHGNWDAVTNIQVPEWRKNLESEVIYDMH
jgi:tRNA (Thr-GGU) A37 N-methylase